MSRDGCQNGSSRGDPPSTIANNQALVFFHVMTYREIKMKFHNALKLASLAIALSAPLSYAADTAAPVATSKAPASKAHILNRSEIDTLLATPDKVVFIDVRRPDEVTSIGGFPVYLSIQSKDLEKNLAFIPRDRTIVVVSNHAGRAGKAA